MGVCFGGYLSLQQLRIPDKNERSPYILMIGPHKKIDQNDIQSGYSDFYEALFDHRDVETALEEMKKITSLNILHTPEFIINKLIEDLNKRINSNEFIKQPNK